MSYIYIYIYIYIHEVVLENDRVKSHMISYLLFITILTNGVQVLPYWLKKYVGLKKDHFEKYGWFEIFSESILGQSTDFSVKTFIYIYIYIYIIYIYIYIYSTLEGSPLKLVDKFTYLGSSVESTEKDIETRLTKAWTAINRLSIIWKSDLTDEMKRSFFQAAVTSILLYGCTTWTLTNGWRRN